MVYNCPHLLWVRQDINDNIPHFNLHCEVSKCQTKAKYMHMQMTTLWDISEK